MLLPDRRVALPVSPGRLHIAQSPPRGFLPFPVHALILAAELCCGEGRRPRCCGQGDEAAK
jgi:hypothetical protein